MFPNLDAEMARKKMKRGVLAKKLNKTPTTMSLKLNGKAPITLAECIEIKKALETDLSIDYLFSTENEK